MLNNDSNPIEVSAKKARFEIQYYGMSFEDFAVDYGNKENYKSSEVIEYITKY